jgi:hypothetical protein
LVGVPVYGQLPFPLSARTVATEANAMSTASDHAKTMARIFRILVTMGGLLPGAPHGPAPDSRGRSGDHCPPAYGGESGDVKYFYSLEMAAGQTCNQVAV